MTFNLQVISPGARLAIREFTANRHGDPWLKAVPGQVAVSAARAKGTHLAARYKRIARRRGRKGALVAVGHAVLIAVWTMLTANDLTTAQFSCQSGLTA